MTVLIVAFFGAALSALGMGGGGILLIYLTAYLGLDQLAAQGINLVFFIPIAAVALAIHMKNKLVQWKIVLPCVLFGLPGVFLGARLAEYLGSDILQKVFAGFLVIIGIREIFSTFLSEKKSSKRNVISLFLGFFYKN